MMVPESFGINEAALTEIVVPNDLRRAKEPEGRILAEVTRRGYDADTVFAIKLSLEEALTNAVKHGNCNDPDKRITVRYYVDECRTVVMVRDQGCGFQLHAIPDPTAEENLERPNGRGLMLMQSYMTKV
ncbi:MAG: ATP-binding protein, partial [Phycisphaerae bacterium]|nr:ATP-binding protein [Phycisphaerae bacterium]